jgi:hypothetical protein
VFRILLDENLPVALKGLLVGHDARTVRDMGWLGRSNGALLDAIQRAGFGLLITADKNLAFQQSLAARKIALVVLSTNQWRTIRSDAERILRALEQVSVGSYNEVALSRPKLRRRPAQAARP